MDDQIKNILTYNNSAADISINYAMLFFNIIPLLLLMHSLPSNYGAWRYSWIAMLLFLFMFQVYLQLLLCSLRMGRLDYAYG